jgi:hypothetical protein
MDFPHLSEEAAKVVEMRRFIPSTVTIDPVPEPRLPRISATPFRWRDPKMIPPREWVYGFHYVRQFVSTTVAPGGVGKSSLSIVEALSICTGRALLGIKPEERARVWLWNGEDPMDELGRRVQAAMMFYRVEPEEVEGWLFLDSGRDSEICLAAEGRDGTRLAQPSIEALEATIRDNGIGVAILDPFVSVHRVSENDNGAIDMVAKALAGIANRTRCAFDLIHHVRKTNGAEVTVEDGRGAVSLLSAARCARAVNSMGKDEAERWGVKNPRSYFRYYNGKANLAPPADTSTWFKFDSVDIENAMVLGGVSRPSDRVGVVTRWEPPKPFDDVTTEHMNEVRRRAGDGDWRLDVQSSEWIGYAVADVLGIDASEKAAKSQVKAVLKAWLASGALKTAIRKDEKRKPRTFVVPGDFEGAPVSG